MQWTMKVVVAIAGWATGVANVYVTVFVKVFHAPPYVSGAGGTRTRDSRIMSTAF